MIPPGPLMSDSVGKNFLSIILHYTCINSVPMFQYFIYNWICHIEVFFSEWIFIASVLSIYVFLLFDQSMIWYMLEYKDYKILFYNRHSVHLC